MEIINPEVENYIKAHSSIESSFDLLEKEIVQNLGFPTMLVGSYEGLFLQMLVEIIGAKNVLEIGTFGGFSAINMLEAIKQDGKLITLEINPTHAEYAKALFKRYGYEDRAEVILGDATKTINQLNPFFDLIFIDADKTNYKTYYEKCLELISDNGLIVIDNTLWSLKVLNPDPSDDDAMAIAKFNDYLVSDKRVKVIQLPIRDGVSLVKKAG